MGPEGITQTPRVVPPVDAEPRAILVGDSHVLALQQGCEALGIPVMMLKSGGLHWNNNSKIKIYAPRRAKTPFMPALAEQVQQLEQQLSLTDIFDSKLPVIASIGFHCGHLARAFGDQGHVAWPPPDNLIHDEQEETLFASSALLETFVEYHRAKHFALLQHIARKCPLTVILPPRAPKNETKIRFRHNIDALTNHIAERLTEMGFNIYDPNADLVGPKDLLPWKMVNDDGFHGTPEYGTKVAERLVAHGML